MAYNSRLELRISQEDRKLLEEAAWGKRLKLSEWCRRVLVATAQAQTKKSNDS